MCESTNTLPPIPIVIWFALCVKEDNVMDNSGVWQRRAIAYNCID